VTSSTVSSLGTKRAFNFNPGPAALPLPVLERMRAELLDYRGTGMSVMELSHRSAEFEAINDKAEQGLRRVMGVPDDYAVLFLQGGGSLQFAMVPMNLYLPGKPVDVLHTGSWTSKAIGELKKLAEHRLAASTETEKFARLPRKDEIKLAPDASYVYVCTNNTIEGSQWNTLPETASVPLVADMSSDILSRPTDVRRFGLIFAGAQKNLGPSGVTVVIIRRDLAERANEKVANVVFRVAGGDEAIEKKFGQAAAAAGLIGVKGHRSVGGMRVSLYNAVAIEAVDAIVSFMRDFERKNG
jgi:phosphoserine aminotransferase